MASMFLLLTLGIFRARFGIGGGNAKVKAVPLPPLPPTALAGPSVSHVLEFIPYKTYIKSLFRTGMSFIFFFFTACNRM